MATALAIEGLKKTFGSHVAVEDVSLTVQQGEIFGFLGPNGAGKTTTLRCLMNFLKVDAGTIRVLGKDAQAESDAVKQLVGYIPSDHHLVDHWTGREHIVYVSQLRRIDSLPDDLIEQFSLDLDKKVKALSTGNRQKLNIILGLIGQPKLIVMDEPTQGLDPLFQNTVYQLLREFRNQGGTVFVSSHNLPEVQRICDRVGIIRQGKLIAEESLDSLREKSRHIIRARFAQPVARSVFANKNFTIQQHDKHSIELTVQGGLDPALKILAKHPVLDLEVTHASLEEIFLELYQ